MPGFSSYDNIISVLTATPTTTFTASSTTLTVSALVVAGGGAGGISSNTAGGGGGAGGVILTTLTLSAGISYPVVVGAGGGFNGSDPINIMNGGNSGISNFSNLNNLVVAYGGGQGSNAYCSACFRYARTGGSGGGAGGHCALTASTAFEASGGLGVPNQGHNGGNNASNTNIYAAGGGGAGGAAPNVTVTATASTSGGIGISTAISGILTYYGGGGGGGGGTSRGLGGLGGGGCGWACSSIPRCLYLSMGKPNTGGGGGGNGRGPAIYPSGGSGVVIVSYISTTPILSGGTLTSYTSGGHTYQVHTFNNSGFLNYNTAYPNSSGIDEAWWNKPLISSGNINWGSTYPYISSFGAANFSPTFTVSVTGTIYSGNTTAGGGISFPNVSPSLRYLFSFGAVSNTPMTIMVYDRLVSSFVYLGNPSVQIVNTPPLPRYTNGVGVQAWFENSYTTPSFGSTSFLGMSLYSYVNQSGTTVTTVSAANTTSTPGSSTLYAIQLPLAPGDTGIQSVKSVNLKVSTGNSANFGSIVLLKPLAYLSIPTAGLWSEKDFMLQFSNMPRIYDGANLGFMTLSSATTTGNIFARILTGYN